MANLIKADGGISKIEHIQTMGLDDFQKLVGGYIEPIYGVDYVAIVNEEGLLKRLPLNMRASNMMKAPLVGDVIIMSWKEWKNRNQ